MGSWFLQSPQPDTGSPGGDEVLGQTRADVSAAKAKRSQQWSFLCEWILLWHIQNACCVCVCCFLHCFLNIHHDVSLPFQLPRLREWDGNGMGMTNAFVIHHIHLREQRPFVPFAIALDMHGPMVHLHGQDLDRSRLSQLTATPRHPFPIPWTVAVGVAMQDTFCHVDHLWSGRSYDLQLRQVQPSGGGVSRERIQA